MVTKPRETTVQRPLIFFFPDEKIAKKVGIVSPYPKFGRRFTSSFCINLKKDKGPWLKYQWVTRCYKNFRQSIERYANQHSFYIEHDDFRLGCINRIMYEIYAQNMVLSCNIGKLDYLKTDPDILPISWSDVDTFLNNAEIDKGFSETLSNFINV